MRARHRHLNAKGFGSGAVFDSRYIVQSDNTTVSSWTDLSGNSRNVEQSTEASKPTFQTNECGGNGVVNFNGTSQFLSFSSNYTGVFYAIYVGKDGTTTSSFISYPIAGNNRGYFASWGNTQGAGVFDSFRAIEGHIDTALFRDAFAILSNTRRKVFKNGTEVTYRANQTTDANPIAGMTISRIGKREEQNIWFKGDLAQINLFDSVPSESARKRLEHAAAFSFKIACS